MTDGGAPEQGGDTGAKFKRLTQAAPKPLPGKDLSASSASNQKIDGSNVAGKEAGGVHGDEILTMAELAIVAAAVKKGMRAYWQRRSGGEEFSGLRVGVSRLLKQALGSGDKELAVNSVQEVLRDRRSFREVTVDMDEAWKIADPEIREKEVGKLRKEIEPLEVVANSVGLFDSVKSTIGSEEDFYFREALDLVSEEERAAHIGINSARYETEAKGLRGYDSKLEGMVARYCELANMNWEWALSVARGGPYESSLRDEILAKAWGTVPGRELVNRATKWVRTAEIEQREKETALVQAEAQTRARGSGRRDAGGFDTKLDLPTDLEEQRRAVRGILNEIEKSNRDIVMDWSLSSTVKALEGALESMEVGVADEVRARLAVYDSAYLIKQADGWIRRSEGNPGHTIVTAAAEVRRRGHALTKHTVETLLKEGLDGYNVAGAWDLLQDVNVVGDNKYKDYVSKAQQAGLITADVAKSVSSYTDFKNYSYYTDSNVVRREAVRKVLVNELGGGEKGEKSLQLAEGLAVASLETSVWNMPAGVGNDQLAEIIWLKDWRTEKRFKVGRAGGPPVHLGFIEGFGNSWLRTEIPENSEAGGRNKPIHASQIAFDGIKVDAWSGHCIISVGRYNELRDLLLSESPKPNETKVTSLKGMVQHFNTADSPEGREKCGKKKLRVYWLLGVVDSALAYDELGWDAAALNDLKKAATKDRLSEEAGTFITPEQWKWIEKATNWRSRVVIMTTARAFRVGLGVGKK